MKMMLSQFIEKLETQANSPKSKNLAVTLRVHLAAKGDVQIDLDHMCTALGVVI